MLTWDKQTFGYGGNLRRDSKCVYIHKETEFLLWFDNIKCIWMFAVCITINTALLGAPKKEHTSRSEILKHKLIHQYCCSGCGCYLAG